MKRTQDTPREEEARRNQATQFETRTNTISAEQDFEILSTQSLEKNLKKISSTRSVDMPGCLKVKAALQREEVPEAGSSPEIRRFSVGDVTYPGLLTAVRTAFRVSDKVDCSICWKDSDEDLVQFSSTEELRHAIESMDDDTLRLYVTFTPAGDIEEPLQSNHNEGDALSMQCNRKGRMMKLKPAADTNEKFHAVRQRVPSEFRAWVRQFVRTWFQQGGAQTADQSDDTLPAGAPPHFRQWLSDFLFTWSRKAERQVELKEAGGEEEEEGEEGFEVLDVELLPAPEGLPEEHYQWLCFFMPRFHRRQRMNAGAAAEESHGGHHRSSSRRHGGGTGEGHGCQKKHGRHGNKSCGTETEDSDSGEKLWKKVPEVFRKHVRLTLRLFHEDKADNPKLAEKAANSGLSPEVLEFVQQTLLEWHSKLSHKRPWAVSKEMMEEERALPAGVESEHFRWMCRFVARWHRMHAGKCDVMSAWSRGEEDCTSGDEGRHRRRHSRKEGQGCQRHHGRHGDKRESQGNQSCASETEDTDCGEQLWKKVPEVFRKHVRLTLRLFHKDKADNPKLAEKAANYGLSPEVLEFVQQTLLEWHSKLSHKRPWAVSKEMMEEERALPAGVESEHFRWMCRFVARWHRMHAGKCDVMSAWTSGEEDCTSGEEGRHRRRHSRKEGQGCQRHHGRHGDKRESQGNQSCASETEDTDCSDKLWKKVPEVFRKHVRLTLRLFHKDKADNPKLAEKAANSGLSPEVLEFVQQTLLEWHSKLSHKRPWAVSKEMMEEERALPAGVESEHFRWMCRFVARWHRMHAGKCDVMSAWSSGEEDCTSGDEGCHRRRHSRKEGQGCQKHHGRHGDKRESQGNQSCASETEDTDCGEKLWKKVPEVFRKHVRLTLRLFHKDKADNPKLAEKAANSDLSPEVLEFVQQTLLEWHSKLSHKRPWAVSKEMMEEERALPAGVESEHFRWMCRFVARWHRMHAGKCDVMSSWTSGEEDDTSGEEDTSSTPGCTPGQQRRSFWGLMGGMLSYPLGMMAGLRHPFAAMNHHRHHQRHHHHGCGPPPPTSYNGYGWATPSFYGPYCGGSGWGNPNCGFRSGFYGGGPMTSWGAASPAARCGGVASPVRRMGCGMMSPGKAWGGRWGRGGGCGRWSRNGERSSHC